MAKKKTETESLNIDLKEFGVEADEFLDIKKGAQLKNQKSLKSKLTQIDGSLNIIEDELYMVIYYVELMMNNEDGFGDFKGDFTDALDKLSDIMGLCSKASTIMDDVKKIKGEL